MYLALTLPGKPKGWPLIGERSWRWWKKGRFCEQRPADQPGEQTAPCPVSQNVSRYRILAKLYLMSSFSSSAQYHLMCASTDLHYKEGKLETSQNCTQSPELLWLLRDAEMMLSGKSKHPSSSCVSHRDCSSAPLFQTWTLVLIPASLWKLDKIHLDSSSQSRSPAQVQAVDKQYQQNNRRWGRYFLCLVLWNSSLS